VATVKFKFLNDGRKVFLGYNKVLGHEPEALKTIFAVYFLRTTQPFCKREA
jgi:hypothetical protein